MQVFRFCYNWKYYWKHPFLLIWSMIYDITKGVKNVVRWIPAVWINDPWDYSDLLKVMEFQLRSMEKCHGKDAWHEDSSICEKELKLASALCRRIQDDDYVMNKRDMYDYGPELGPWARKSSKKGIDTKENKPYSEYMIKQDIELLTKLMNRKMRNWWT